MINQVDRPVLDALRNDPGLLDDMWRIFEWDQLGWELCGEVPPRTASSARQENAAEHRPFETSWMHAIDSLSRDGTLDRDRLHRALIGSLQMNAPWGRLRWYADTLELLAFSRDELARESGGYVGLLRAPTPQAVAIGQRVTQELLTDGVVGPDEVLAVGSAPLYGKDKTSAMAQLRLLDGIAADPAWRDAAVIEMCAAFGHPRVDVQRAAVERVGRHRHELDAAAAERLALAAEDLAPSVRVELQPDAGIEVDTGRDVGGVWSGPVTPSLPPPLTDDQFVQVLAAFVHGNAEAAMFDRAVEASIRIGALPAVRRRELVAPLVRSSTGASTLLGWWAVLCVQALNGTFEGFGVPAWRKTLAYMVIHDAIQAVLAGVDRPWFAAPTDALGNIDERTAARRRSEIDALPVEQQPGRAEVAAFHLRSRSTARQLVLDRFTWSAVAGDGGTFLDGRGVHFEARATLPPDCALAGAATLFPEGGKLRSPDQWTVGDAPQRWHGDRAAIQLVGSVESHWYYLDATDRALAHSLTPHHPDLALAHALPRVGHDLEAESGWLTSPTLGIALGRLAFAGTPVGELTPLALALGMGAKPVALRVAAAEALIACCRDKGVDPQQVGDAVARLCGGGVLKLSRIATACGDVLQRDPSLARDLAIAVLDGRCDTRDAHRVLTVLADAIAVAGPSAMPNGLSEIARRSGSSKLVSEARRVVKLNAEG